MWGLLGGFIAWVLTNLIAHPLHRFISLRSEAARLLALYEDRFDVTNPEAPRPPEDWLAERRRAYDTFGADLTGFAFSNSIFTRMLHRLRPKRFRCYPRNAGSAFVALSQAAPGTSADNETRQSIMRYLKLRYRP